MERRDPVERATGETRDLYDISTWEPRTFLDRLSVGVYSALAFTGRAVLVLVALVILVIQLLVTGLAAIGNPLVGTFALLSVVPALALAVYIWRADVTMSEPLTLLVGTFLLGVLFASFAAVFNTYAQPFFQRIPVVGLVLFFYLVVGPVEETVKWLAVRLWAFGDDRFDAVIDGAVYGAMAGLGFATIENALYITQQYTSAAQAGGGVIGVTAGTAALRTFAGPGHVIFSAFAGYYLGLAKFNRENAGPIVIKGLLVATFIHATYNALVTFLPALLSFTPAADAPPSLQFIGFVLVYDGFFGYLLYRKLSRYRAAYHDAHTTGSVSFGSSDE